MQALAGRWQRSHNARLRGVAVEDGFVIMRSNWWRTSGGKHSAPKVLQRVSSLFYSGAAKAGHSLMQKFLIQNEFGATQELLGQELIIPGFEDLQFILHAWLYDKNGGWAVTERTSGKRIASGPAGSEDRAQEQLEYLLRVHGKDALMRVLGSRPASD